MQFQFIAQVAQMLVISGSVSPTTERQIAYAKADGFDAVAADPLSLAQGQTVVPLVQARKLLAQGKSPHVYSAAGPTSDRGSALHTIANGRETLSKSLGKIVRQLIKKFKLKRLVIAVSDTSSHAL